MRLDISTIELLQVMSIVLGVALVGLLAVVIYRAFKRK